MKVMNLRNLYITLDFEMIRVETRRMLKLLLKMFYCE